MHLRAPDGVTQEEGQHTELIFLHLLSAVKAAKIPSLTPTDSMKESSNPQMNGVLHTNYIHSRVSTYGRNILEGKGRLILEVIIETPTGRCR